MIFELRFEDKEVKVVWEFGGVNGGGSEFRVSEVE